MLNLPRGLRTIQVKFLFDSDILHVTCHCQTIIQLKRDLEGTLTFAINLLRIVEIVHYISKRLLSKSQSFKILVVFILTQVSSVVYIWSKKPAFSFVTVDYLISQVLMHLPANVA